MFGKENKINRGSWLKSVESSKNALHLPTLVLTFFSIMKAYTIYEKWEVKYNSLLPVDEISPGATAIEQNKRKVNKNC